MSRFLSCSSKREGAYCCNAYLGCQNALEFDTSNAGTVLPAKTIYAAMAVERRIFGISAPIHNRRRVASRGVCTGGSDTFPLLDAIDEQATHDNPAPRDQHL